METPTAEMHRIGPAIVRAWFDTVLNPLIRALDTELTLLTEGNLTWRFQPQGLVSLVPVRSHLMVDAYSNLDQFLSLNPDFKMLVQVHDRGCAALFDACRHLEARLIESEAMRSMFDRLSGSDKLPPGTDMAAIFGACQPPDYLKVLAEYIINGVQRLPSYYSTADFWNRHSNEFLGLRDSDEVRPFWKMADEAKRRFSDAVNRLAAALRKVRNDLSLSEGVPIVERVSP